MRSRWQSIEAVTALEWSDSGTDGQYKRCCITQVLQYKRYYTRDMMQVLQKYYNTRDVLYKYYTGITIQDMYYTSCIIV